MQDSLKHVKQVADRVLEERLEPVKELQTGELESYSIVKDRATGEHYLHYAYVHMNVAAGTGKESYHYLLPLESDDVLGILFGEQPYTYPEHWRHAFLRNGPEGYYVWFDPTAAHEAEEDEKIAEQLRQRLLRFKQQGRSDPEAVAKLMKELDDIRSGDPRRRTDD